jgi:hypothetical protein
LETLPGELQKHFQSLPVERHIPLSSPTLRRWSQHFLPSPAHLGGPKPSAYC